MTGANVAFRRSSTLTLAFAGEVIADRKAGIDVGSVQGSIADAAADGVEETVFDRGREDLHWVAKWLGLLHFGQVFPYALHCVVRSLLFSPCLASPQQMHLEDLLRA